MSEGEKRRPIPIPMQEDYAAGAQLLTERLDHEGSMWNTYHKEALIDLYNQPKIFELHEAMATVAKLIEPIKDDDHRPIDPMYRASHAFKAGMWTASRLLELVYDRQLNYSTAHFALCKALPFSPDYKDQEQYEANGQLLENTGENGLELVGYEAREHIDKWSKDMVSDERVRRQYCLGTGAILFSAHGVYTTVFEEMKCAYEASKLFRLDELDQYLADAAKTSDN